MLQVKSARIVSFSYYFSSLISHFSSHLAFPKESIVMVLSLPKPLNTIVPVWENPPVKTENVKLVGDDAGVVKVILLLFDKFLGGKTGELPKEQSASSW